MARKALEALADSLEKNYPGAAASPCEGLEETITINRLMLTGALRRTIRSTNPIESAIEIAKTTARRVKRWRNGDQVLRWTLASLKAAERRFRRVAGYRELPLVRTRLKAEVLNIATSEATNARKIKRGCATRNSTMIGTTSARVHRGTAIGDDIRSPREGPVATDGSLTQEDKGPGCYPRYDLVAESDIMRAVADEAEGFERCCRFSYSKEAR